LLLILLEASSSILISKELMSSMPSSFAFDAIGEET